MRKKVAVVEHKSENKMSNNFCDDRMKPGERENLNPKANFQIKSNEKILKSVLLQPFFLFNFLLKWATNFIFIIISFYNIIFLSVCISSSVFTEDLVRQLKLKIMRRFTWIFSLSFIFILISLNHFL